MLAQPTAQSATMFDLVRARLEGTTFASPVSGMRLRAERLEEGGTELSLFAGRDPDPEIVGIALGRLEAALGPQAARRAHVARGNRYEARLSYEPFTANTLATAVAGAASEPQPETGTFMYRILVPRAVDVRVRHGRPAFVGADAALECAGPWRAGRFARAALLWFKIHTTCCSRAAFSVAFSKKMGTGTSGAFTIDP